MRVQCVGYEIIDSAARSLAIIISYPTSASGIIVFIKTPTKYREFFPTLFGKQPIFSLFLIYHIWGAWYDGSYYIDTSVLLENIPLVKFIKTTSAEWFIFHNLTREFINDVISVISLHYFIDVFLSIQ